MTGAVKAMNKISKDIDKHPQVAAVLRRQNEAKTFKYFDTRDDAHAHAKKTMAVRYL